jgi:hypothetical protein
MPVLAPSGYRAPDMPAHLLVAARESRERNPSVAKYRCPVNSGCRSKSQARKQFSGFRIHEDSLILGHNQE